MRVPGRWAWSAWQDGTGIVEVFARNGVQVIAAEVDAGAVSRDWTHLETSTARAVERGKRTEGVAAKLLGRITTTTSLVDLAEVDLVVEAIPEHLDPEAHYATADDINAAMKTGCALPMGLFELLDVVGLDVSPAIERSLYSEFGESGLGPAPLLEHLVTAGWLGHKTGHGFPGYAGR